ncbi:phytoene desaturase family protein [Reichenbachiella versicolor]|uniref:phytoene desaturase family protein n=1 Tax=Reichenbachiella versicolor TaxID=1821036 RepID=UPI000D6E6FC5|nr:phytoene desaturase family protein [Reichenbachiella versicolor]
MSTKISIIGAGFSSLSAACYLAQAGNNVTVIEKNTQPGGRARVYEQDGFKFDMGPSWYWMPDVFESFFADFNKKPSDYYQLNRLDPGYSVYFNKADRFDIGASLQDIYTLFENEESGSSKHLKSFLKSAEDNYNIAILDLVYKPGLSLSELITVETAKKLDQFFKTIQQTVRKKIKSPKLRQILEFPVLFLGAKPSNTPAFYNFMNHADFGLGTWHPEGGMFEVVRAMYELAIELGVTFRFDEDVTKINVSDKKAVGIQSSKEYIESDLILSGADYHFTETLLPLQYRQYSEKYWKKKTFAPSSLLFYIAFDKKLKNISHHTLFFDTDFEKHAKSIYDDINWPESPMFYANFPSVTDKSFAPEGKEVGTFLIPIAPGIEDNEDIRNKYLEIILKRLEFIIDQKVGDSILFSKSYCVSDFVSDYNSYKGNAYGLANTLLQTAYLRPKIKSSKINNLFFTGQLTVPGPGVPPSLISGKVVANQIIRIFNKTLIYEKAV